MISHIFARLSLVLGLAFSILPCHAQQVALQFLSFPKSLEKVKLELRVGGDATVEIGAPSNELSKPNKVARLANWVVGESSTGEDGKPTFKVFGQAPALASPKQIIILIRKGEENADGFDVIAIDGRIDAFGGGKFLFVNAAKVDIAGKVGEEKFAVRPGAHKLIKPKVDGGKRTAHAMFYFRKEKEARSFFSSRWPVGGKARSMVFFYHDPATKRLRMHTIRDFPR